MGTSRSSFRRGDGDELQQGPCQTAWEDCAEEPTVTEFAGRTCHFHGDILAKLYDQQHRGPLRCCSICQEGSPGPVALRDEQGLHQERLSPQQP